MKIDKLHKAAVRSSDDRARVTQLSESELKNAVGGGIRFFCSGPGGLECIIYITPIVL